MAGDGRGIGSIEIGMRLLEQLALASRPMTLGEAAAACAMSPSKAHLYLKSFTRLGYVSQPSLGGRYQLGPAAIRIGVAALACVDVLERARAATVEIRDMLGETVYLSVWGNRGPTIVSRVQGFGWAPLEVRVGSVLPPMSATGRAFLAWLPESAWNGMLGSPPSVADTAEIGQVRRDGVARGNATVASGSGFAGLAAPVFDHDDTVAGVITVIGDLRSFDMSNEGTNTRTLLSTSRRISDELRFPRAMPRESS